jgi:predicted N-acetyltransferase YhbS
MRVKIRRETPADHYAVEEITRDAFWRFWEEDEGRKICDEHLLVHKLRNVEALVPELNCVAELDGKIVGHIIYTKSRIESDDGKNYETLTFGPLTVSPEYQSQGIGRALMQHTFEEARKLGYRAVIIFGHPDYYPRVGFQHAMKLGISPPGGEAGDAFLAYVLCEGALDGISGKYYIDDVYMQITQEEAMEFDKRFPPKKPHVTTPIDVLLNRLEPDAEKGLKEKGFKTLDFLKSQSEREVSSIPGMDKKAIEKVRNIMHEYNFPWGEGK